MLVFVVIVVLCGGRRRRLGDFLFLGGKGEAIDVYESEYGDKRFDFEGRGSERVME